MDRKQTTEKLLGLIKGKTLKPGVYGATEVAIDWGTAQPRYVDFMTFSPANTVHVSGIEKGIFTCYEIKSCYEDLYSGKGLNFIGEKNYLVTTMEVYKRILDDQKWDLQNGISSYSEGRLAAHILSCNPESKHRVGYDVGIYVALPEDRSEQDELEEPTPIDSGQGWTLRCLMSCKETTRKRSMTELLFLMMKARSR